MEYMSVSLMGFIEIPISFPSTLALPVKGDSV